MTLHTFSISEVRLLVAAIFLGSLLAPTVQAQAQAAAPTGWHFTPLIESVISPPHWFTGTDGKVHLVYELLLTNALTARRAYCQQGGHTGVHCASGDDRTGERSSAVGPVIHGCTRESRSAAAGCARATPRRIRLGCAWKLLRRTPSPIGHSDRWS